MNYKRETPSLQAFFGHLAGASTSLNCWLHWGTSQIPKGFIFDPQKAFIVFEGLLSSLLWLWDYARQGLAPAHPYLPKLLITIFGHTPYLPQGDTMFLGHPNYIVEFP